MSRKSFFSIFILVMAAILLCGCTAIVPPPRDQTTPTVTQTPESDALTPTIPVPAETMTPIVTQASARRGGSSSRRSSGGSSTPIPTPAPVVNASFTANVTSGKAPLSVAFTDTSTNAPAAWIWNATDVAGNNTPFTFSTVQHPIEVFGVGNYAIVLTASNAAGSDTSDPLWINVTAPCSGTIGGIVWNDSDRDGVQDAGEPGLPGVGVEIADPSSSTVLQTRTTDTNGTYQFDGLCAGTYDVRVNATTLPPGFAPAPALVGDPAADSNGSPATVTLPADSSADLTIDFGYYELAAGVSISTLTNGEDADTPPGPIVPVGSAIAWTYAVTNTGDLTLNDVTVTDDRGVTVTCPKTVLAAGESMTCTATGTAVAGQYANVGTVTANPPTGPPLTASDPSHYRGVVPAVDVEKEVSGDGGATWEDADTPPGPMLPSGIDPRFRFTVTNTGNVALSNVEVTDDVLGWIGTIYNFEPGTSMQVIVTSPFFIDGQHTNVATVVGEYNGQFYSDTDTANYFGFVPMISIEVLTNGEDADTPPGPNLTVGAPVLWTYIATNLGNVPLTDVAVTDDHGATVTCPKTVLDPGESMTCIAPGTAVAGQYANIGTASGTPPVGPAVTASDPSHYYGWET